MKYILLTISMLSLFVIAGCGEVEDGHTHEPGTPDDHNHDEPTTTTLHKIDDGGVPATGGSVQVINMIAKQWEFEPSSITVNKGDTVKISIESVDVAHGIGLPAFGISERLEPGETTDIEFVADQEGTHTFFCNVQCGHGHSDMSGELIVV